MLNELVLQATSICTFFFLTLGWVRSSDSHILILWLNFTKTVCPTRTLISLSCVVGSKYILSKIHWPRSRASVYFFFFFDFIILSSRKTKNENKSSKNWEEGGAWDHDLSRRQLLIQLSHPGAPVLLYIPYPFWSSSAMVVSPCFLHDWS